MGPSPGTPSKQPVPLLAYSPKQSAQALGVSRDYLDQHIGKELRWIARGGRKMVAITELHRWIERNSALMIHDNTP